MTPEKADEVARVRTEIWRRIRETQDKGFIVEPGGGYRPINNRVCLIGAITIGEHHGDMRTKHASDSLGINFGEAMKLECGFEQWCDGSAHRDHTYYNLGREIREQLASEQSAG